MTKRLAALEARGLVRRDPDPDDGRSTTVALTPAGERLVETALADHVANGARLVGGLTAAQRGELAELLRTLALSLGDEAGARRRLR
jgi:DNA-binding MarR family transcriptional regulator